MFSRKAYSEVTDCSGLPKFVKILSKTQEAKQSLSLKETCLNSDPSNEAFFNSDKINGADILSDSLVINAYAT